VEHLIVKVMKYIVLIVVYLYLPVDVDLGMACLVGLIKDGIN
jgi:hypothetical protein